MRKQMIENDAVDCMVALPGQLFYSTQIPACLWFLAKDKSANGHRDRRGEILFIDARKMGVMSDRTRRELSGDDISLIAGTYHSWRNKDGGYEDVPGFCKVATRDDLEKHRYSLTPGLYVGTQTSDEDEAEFEERVLELTASLQELFEASRDAEGAVLKALSRVSANG